MDRVQASTGHKGTLTPELLLAVHTVADAQIHPDGTAVAFVLGDQATVDGHKHPKQTIWLAASDGLPAIPFTAGPRADTMPRWSPDGRTLAFLSDREKDGTFALYLMARSGGEARKRGDWPASIATFAWSPDGQSIAVLVPDGTPEEKKRRREARDDAVEVEEHPIRSRVWLLDVGSGEARPVTPDGLHVWELAWAPDGRRLAVVASDDPDESAWYGARLVVQPIDGGEPTTIHQSARQVALGPWSPDVGSIAFCSCTWSDRGVVGGDLYIVPAGGGEAQNFTPGFPGSITWASWQPDGSGLLVTGYERGRSFFGRVSPAKGAEIAWRGAGAFVDRMTQRFTASADGRMVAAVHEAPGEAPQVWLGRVGGSSVEWRQIGGVPNAMDGWPVGDLREVRWKARDGLDLQGWLQLPQDTAGEGPLPLVVLVHGGPASLWTERWHTSGQHAWALLLAGRGVAVFMPNPRGSTGFGVAFAEANLGDMGGADYHDVMAGVDALIDRGLADPERLGIAGWSYGGFMTAWAITQTRRFNAAVMGAGICDWRSFHGTSSIPAWDALFYRAGPYADDGPYATFSPIRYVDRVATPTLILHGEDDDCVPVGQAHQMFRALKERGVEVKLVVYPREGHRVQEYQHVHDLMRRGTAWLCERLLTAATA